MVNILERRISHQHYSAIIMGLVIVLFIGVLIWLNRPQEGDTPTAASQYHFEIGEVYDVIDTNLTEDTWTQGLQIGTQEVAIHLETGTYQGQTLYTYNYVTAYGNIDLEEGTKVVVRVEIDDDGNPYVVYIANYHRFQILAGLAIIFMVLLVTLGGKKGLSAIAGLIFTILSIWFFLIPLIERGFPAIPSTIMLVSITTLVSLYLLNGSSKKTWIATIGCIGGVTIAGLTAMITTMITPMSGFNMPEAEELVLRAADTGIDIKGLLVSGILIASLGAVMDVAMTIVSAISELKSMNTRANHKQLFKSGLNIGRDAMGTMANTLILAFAGTSLNMLVLFRIFDYPYRQIMNSDLMAIEMIQGLSGSIGIVLTVPLVAALGAFFYGKNSREG